MRPKKRYMPKADLEFNIWQKNFIDKVALDPAAYGLTPAGVAGLQAARAAWESKLATHHVTQNAAKSATRGKNEAGDELKALLRSAVGTVQSKGTVTDDQRKALAITVKDRERTLLSRDYIMTVKPPLIQLVPKARGLCVIHYGSAPGRERRNRKPPGVGGAFVFCRYPEAEDDTRNWHPLAGSSRSPYYHKLDNPKPVLVEYKVCWVDTTLQFGPFSDPAEAAITPVRGETKKKA